MTEAERYDAWLAMWRRLGMIVVIERANRTPQGFFSVDRVLKRASMPPLGTFTVSRVDKYRRGDIEDSFGRRLFRDGKGRL